jgi:tyrosine-protein kinase Etk/Wzc
MSILNNNSKAPISPSNAAESSEGSSFSIVDVIDTVLQYWWVILSVWLSIAVAGVLYAMSLRTIYQADALVQVEDKKNASIGGLKDIASAFDIGQSPVLGEIDIIKSRELIYKAITVTRADLIAVPTGTFPLIGHFFAARHNRISNDLAPPLFGLSGWAWGGEKVVLDVLELPEQYLGKQFVLQITNKNAWSLTREGLGTVATGLVGQLIEFKVGKSTGKIKVNFLQGQSGTKFALQRNTMVASYASVISGLKVAETARLSSVIRIQYESENPAFAVVFVNELAKAYLTQNVNRRSEEAQKSLAFLEQQLPEIKKSMEVSEESLNAFRTRTQTVNVERENDSLLQKTVQVESSRIQLELKRKELLQRYKDDHPILASVTEQLRTMEGESGKINREVSKLPEQQRDFLRLARDVQVGSQLYTALLNSSQELKIAKAGTIGNVRIIDYAVVPENPIKPKRSSIVYLAVILGFLLGVLSCFVARALRPTLRNTEELENTTGLISYASIPESSIQTKLFLKAKIRKNKTQGGKHNLLSLINPGDPAVESIRSLRTGLAFSLADATNKNILITGPTAGLGKSFVAANLAVVIAASGKRVLIVDCDLRRPRLDTYFGVPKVPGLSDLLSGSVAAAQAIKASPMDGVHVLTAGTSVPNPAELLLSSRFEKLLSELSTVYDHIVFDSAPVLPVGDTLAVAPLCGITMLVARAEQTTPREINEAARKLTASGATVNGVIFNGIKRGRMGYGYTYKYHYTYGNK